MGTLQIVLDKGQQEDWFNSNLIIGGTIITIAAFIWLIWNELTHDHPVVNLRLFKNLTFSTGNMIMFVVGFCLYSSIMLIPLFLQVLMGYSATDAGMVMAPGGVATLVTMPLVGAMLNKYDGRKIVATGLTISALSMFMMQQLSLEAGYGDFVWPRVVLGIGLAMVFVPLTTVTLAVIDREQMGNATGIFNLLRNIGGSVGIAVAATLLSRYAQFYQTVLTPNITPYHQPYVTGVNVLKQKLIQLGVPAPSVDHAANQIVYGQVMKQAATLAYNHIFFIVGIAFLVIIPLLLLLKKPTHHDPSVVAH